MGKTRIRPRKLIVPAWPEPDRFTVDPSNEDFILEYTFPVMDPVSEEDNFFGHEDFLGPFLDAPRRTRESSRLLPHIRFLNSVADEEVLAFVVEVGPVQAKIERIKPYGIRAVQSKAVFFAEQDVFSSAHKLVQTTSSLAQFAEQLFSESYDPYESTPSRLPSQLLSLDMRKKLTSLGRDLEMLNQSIKEARRESEVHALPCNVWNHVEPAQSSPMIHPALDNLAKAHRTLCDIFNAFPPKLFFSHGNVIPSPVVSRAGIRPLLYYMLREVYLEHVLIKRCERDKCGAFFVPDRRDGRYCSDSCKVRHNMQKNYERSKALGLA